MQLPVRTDRLILRAHTMADLDAWQEMYSDPRFVRYLYDSPLDREGAADSLRKRLTTDLPETDGQWLNLGIELDGRLIGDAGVGIHSRQHRQCEIGYVLAPAVQGRGFATEAARAMVDLAFTHLDAHRVFGRLDGRNEASARLLERLGMRREAHLRENEWIKGEWTDEVIYAITEDEWRRPH